MVWNDGSRYSGAFRAGRPHGAGILIGATGERYEGEFEQGRRHGRGVLIERNGDRYEGEFKNGTQNGRGSWRFVDGGSYDGEFAEGVPHGYGEAKLDGLPVVGTWTRGCISGVYEAAIGRSIAGCHQDAVSNKLRREKR